MADSFNIRDLTSILTTGNIPGSADSYLGRITSIEKEGTKQYVLLQSELGRLRIPIEGAFAEGDVLRMVFVNGALRFEKQPIVLPPTLLNQGTSNRPPDLTMLRSVAQFEAEIFKFLMQATENSNTLSKGQKDIPALPVLLQQVLGKQGGLDFLISKIKSLPPQVLQTLTHSLAKWEPRAESNELRDWAVTLNGFRRALTLAGNPQTSTTTGELLAKELMRYLRPSPGSDLYLGRGIVQERLSANTLGQGIQEMARYRIDLGGAMLEAESPDIKNNGDFGVFSLQRESGGRLVARFRNPETELPTELRAHFKVADNAGRASLLVAADFLRSIAGEPEFIPATVDFARLLSDTGRMQGPKVSLPSPDEMEALFRMMLAYPRDAKQPETQAKIWDESVRNQDVFKSFLKMLRPEIGEQVLNSETKLFLAQNKDPIELKNHPGREALSRALSTVTSEVGFPWNALVELAKDAAVSGAKIHGTEKFLLQAMLGLGSDRQESSQGGSQNMFYFHQEEWKPASVQWKKIENQNSGGKAGGEKPPMQIKIVTQTQNLGKVEVDLTLDAKSSKLDFRNEKINARELLSQSLPPLERMLEGMGFKLASWFYAQSVVMQEKKRPTERIELPVPPPIPSGPASMLDVFG